MLINDCENIIEIRDKIEQALGDQTLLRNAHNFNLELRKKLSYETIKKGVLEQYASIEETIN